MAVDLSNLEQVEPTISLLQAALVRYLIGRGQRNNKGALSASTTATTSLYALRSTNFGLAVNDDASAKSMSAAAPEEEHKNICIALAISVVLPSRSTDGENAGAESLGYKEKQAEALVLYHLRKYAASLNAVLCFVRKDKPSEEESKTVVALTANQLSFVWHQLAKGEEGWKELDSTDNSGRGSGDDGDDNGPEPGQGAFSGIYGPGNHHEDLIESVFLRNAQFPGQWDASKDSLWSALPPPEMDKNEAPVANDGSGDQTWLDELRASVASDAKTPPPSASEEGADVGNSKTPNDAAVSSFFESLLKP